MKKNIYLHLDLFSPTVYLRPAGDATAPPMFMIMQPYIFGDTSMDCPDLPAYIDDINTAAPTDYRYIILDETFNSDKIWNKAYPVPFPFNAVISLNGQRINSMMNEHGYVFPTYVKQVEWMINAMSSISVTIKDYVQHSSFLPFSEKDKEVWWNDLLAILTNYIIKEEDNFVSRNISNTATPVFTPEMLNKKVDPAGVSLIDLLKLLERKRLQKTKEDAAITITQGQKENAFKNYADALNLMPTDNQRKSLLNNLGLSSVTLTRKHLEDLKKNVGEDNLRKLFGEFKGYLRSLAFYFKNVYHQTEDGPAGTDKKAEALINALHNYFYFGERTRITAPADNKFHILPLSDSDAQADLPLVTTSVTSLAGQVVNLSMGGALTIRSLNEAGNNPDTQVLATTAMFVNNLELIKRNATDNNRDSFERSLTYINSPANEDWEGLSRTLQANTGLTPEQRDQVINEVKLKYTNLGKASYLPSNSLAKKSEIYQKLGADELRFFPLPQYILDGLEEVGRVNYTDSFAKKNPVRTAISYPDELGNYSISEIKDDTELNTITDYLKQFIPALLFKITVTKVNLPQKEKNEVDDMVFKLSVKAAAEASGSGNFEQGLIDYLFQKGGPLKDPDHFNITLLSDGVIVLENIRPTDAKKDSDELIELYIQGKKNSIPKEQYDLLIYPKNKDDFWQNTNAFFLNGLLYPKHDPVLAPLFIQNKYFNFKYHHSLNGLNTYVRLKLKPAAGFKETTLPDVDTGGMQPVLEDHLNFNKFRLFMKNGAAEPIQINKLDALRPIFDYLETSTAANWVGLYKVLHRFSEELSSKGFGKSSIPLEYETEWNRYLLFKKCGTQYVLKGKPENQYALRLDTKDSNDLALGNSSNVANLALLNEKTKAADGTPINVIALTCEYNRVTKKIQLKLNKEYFKLIVDLGTDKSRYRPVYEAMFELIQSEQANLVVEGWQFDNAIFDLPLEQAVHPELANEIPSHPRYMKREAQDVVISIPAFIADIKSKFDKDDIKQFEQAVTNFQGLVSVEIDCPKALEAADFLRIRLNIFRKKDNSIAVNFNGTVSSDDITPDAWDNFKSADGSTAYKVKLQTSLVDQARGQLSKIITPTVTGPAIALPIGGDLFYSSAFISVDNPLLQADKNLQSNLSLVLGENISFTAFNYNITDPVPAGKRLKYADLFYIPYAVMPLKTVDELGNATETLLFAQYLMKILFSITYPSRSKEDLDFLLGAVKWDTLGDNPSPEALLKANLDIMIDARTVLNKVIALKLADMVTYVDDRDIEQQSPQNDMRDSYKMLVQLYGAKKITDELRKYFCSLFTAKPELFNTAKGFGVGLLQTIFTDGGIIRKLDFASLYSLQINKVINRRRKNEPPNADSQTQVNNTFDFTSIYKLDKPGDYRIFVDILDDEMFDNEFEIIQDSKSNKKSGIQLKNNLRVAGDTAHNVYADSNDAGESINLIHYIDEWKENKGTIDEKKYYLLPSRRPPQRPLEQKVFQKIYYKNSDTTDVKIIQKEVERILFEETDAMLRDNHPTEYTEVKGTAPERVSKWLQKNGTGGLKKGYATDPDTVQFLPDHVALWKRYDKYVSVYTFAIEPDEEAADLGKPDEANRFPFKGFENDKLRIYFKLSGQQGGQDNEFAATAERPDVKKFIALYESYKKRLRGENERPEVKMSEIFDLNKPGEGLIKALTDVLEPLHKEGTSTVAEAFSDNLGVIKITDDGSKNGFQIEFAKNNGGNFIAVLGAMLYKDIFDNNGKPAARFCLSIAMLEDPWKPGKMRLQVDRNSRDFNHDGDPDINPRFEMFSEFSDWADHGQAILDYNFWDGSGEDNRQLADAYPLDLTRVKFESSVGDEYESNLNGKKTIKQFYERAMRLNEARFDNFQLKNAFMRVLISHRTTTNQVIELSRETTPEFMDNFNKGKIGYRDEFIKQKIDVDKCEPNADLTISPDVTALYPFLRIMFYDEKREIPVLAINLQLQWEE